MQYQQFRWHRRWLRLTDPLSLKTVENIERNTNEADTVFFFCHLVTFGKYFDNLCVFSVLWLAVCCPKEINMLRQRPDNIDKVKRGMITCLAQNTAKFMSDRKSYFQALRIWRNC